MSKPSVDIGRVGIWYGMIDALPTPEAQRAAQVVEELGFGALWIAEAVGREPFVAAAVLLSATERLPVATGIANIYARDPMTMAAAQKTLAEALLAPEQMVVLSTDATEARRIARAGMKIYLGLPNYFNNLKRIGFDESDFADGGSDRLVDAIVAWGTEEQIAARVAEHHAAGADHVCVQVLQGGTAMPEQQWRRLAPALLGG